MIGSGGMSHGKRGSGDRWWLETPVSIVLAMKGRVDTVAKWESRVKRR